MCTVVSARWTTVDWSWPKEWNWCARTDFHFSKKSRRGTIHRTLPQNPRMWGKKKPSWFVSNPFFSRCSVQGTRIWPERKWLTRKDDSWPVLKNWPAPVGEPPTSAGNHQYRRRSRPTSCTTLATSSSLSAAIRSTLALSHRVSEVQIGKM